MVVLLICISYFDSVIKKIKIIIKKKQVKSPSIWSRVPELSSDPPIGLQVFIGA